MPGNLKRRLTFEHKSAERGKRNQSCRAGSVCLFFIGLAVVSGNGLAAFIFGHYFQPTRLMAEKDVRNFLHQRRVRAHAAVIRIEYDNSPSIRQRTRTGATGPFFRSGAEKMLARFDAEFLYLLKTNNQQVGKFREPKRIKRRCGPHSRKIAKPQSIKLKSPPLLAWR